ncbi:hypothetical protein BHE74_00055472, partial [Ensete ventricosum]
EATQRAEESQRRETEARGRIQVLETQLQGLGDDLDATRAKTPEAEQSLATTRSALEKVESSLAVEQSTTPERARATIAQY